MSLQLETASYSYICYALTKKRKEGGAGKGNSTQEAVQVCWQT